MQSLRGLKQELSNMGYMKGILQTYEEIAASKMQIVRADLIQAKNYYDGLSDVSHEIGLDIVSVVGEETVISAMVLLSSNSGMFGDLPERVVAEFAKEIDGKICDVFVIGQMGAKLLRSIDPDRNFQVLNLPNEEFDQNSLASVIEQLRGYRQIKLFYGQFINIVRQIPNSRQLSGELTLTSLSSDDRFQKERRLKYLYEPSVESVGLKLGKEIFANIFEETTRQSQLAKFAARLMHLDESLSNLEILNIKTYKLKNRWHRKLDNKKQGLRIAAALGGQQ